MTCGRCGQSEDKCQQCWRKTCPNWFRDKAFLRPCTRERGHTKSCRFEVDMSKNHTLLQGLLRSGVTIAEVIEKYKLKVARHKRYDNLVQFTYDTIECDFSDTLVQQCRGLILDQKNNWEIVARPFDKFFNAGDPLAAKLDWSTARVLRKLDGSCCYIYHYDGGWQVATLGRPDASGEVSGFPGWTFSQLFWDTWAEEHYVVPDRMWEGVTFIFELTTPYNRVVVPHTQKTLTLLGSRLANGSESAIVGTGYKTPVKYNFKNLDECVQTFKEIDGMHNEGYVVVDGKYNRLKIKHPGYCRIHQLKESFTLRNAVELVRKGEDVEFIKYFPEYNNLVTLLKDSYFALVQEIAAAWLTMYQEIDQKKFAALATKYRFSGVLFAVKNGHAINFKQALQKMHIDNLINLMEVKNAKAA